ncbi:hypothetical protein B484DRAFT_224614, partial [Ochromonadaceae sp. CCMP2298]
MHHLAPPQVRVQFASLAHNLTRSDHHHYFTKLTSTQHVLLQPSPHHRRSLRTGQRARQRCLRGCRSGSVADRAQPEGAGTLGQSLSQPHRGSCLGTHRRPHLDTHGRPHLVLRFLGHQLWLQWLQLQELGQQLQEQQELEQVFGQQEQLQEQERHLQEQLQELWLLERVLCWRVEPQ